MLRDRFLSSVDRAVQDLVWSNSGYLLEMDNSQLLWAPVPVPNLYLSEGLFPQPSLHGALDVLAWLGNAFCLQCYRLPLHAQLCTLPPSLPGQCFPEALPLTLLLLSPCLFVRAVPPMHLQTPRELLWRVLMGVTSADVTIITPSTLFSSAVAFWLH